MVSHPVILCAALLALDVVQVTGLSGEKIYLNPSNIVSLHTPPQERKGHFPKAVRCVIYTSDGKFISVTEECAAVRSLLKPAE
jgi:hypothetical protein